MSTGPDANLPEAQRWLEQAAEHFAAAQWTAQGKHGPNACFQFQQAAEMSLKALLLGQGVRVRVHGILHLPELLLPYYPEAGRLGQSARNLDRFYIPTRYPDALPTGTSAAYFREQDAVEAQADSGEVLSFARQKLAPP